MALQSVYKNASEEEIAALYSLNLLVSDDIEDITLKWMLEGKGSNEIAFLASKTHTSLNGIRTEFEKAFDEVEVEIPCEEIALKKILKFHLQQILLCPDQYMVHLYELIDLDRLYANKITLFERPDCDAYFEERNLKYPNAKSAKFAGQEFGIEKLYGLYYSHDDFDKWTKRLEAKRKSKVLVETKIILDKFYHD